MKPSLIARFALIFTLLVALLLVSFAETNAQTVTSEDKPAGERFPTSELSKLPYLHFSDNNLGEAYLFRMQQEESAIVINGQRYIGFRFWSTGLVEWLFINTPGDLQPGSWLLINDSGELVNTIQPTDVSLEDCPRVVARYPQASRVTRYKTEGEALTRRGRYHLLQRVGPGKPAPYALSFTSCSPDSYEAGRSGELLKKITHPPLRASSDVVIENMIAMRRTEGVQAAADYLAREMELRIDDGEKSDGLSAHHRSQAKWSYIGLYTNAWYEAQTGGGRLDADWASAVYGAMYEVCLKRGYFARSDVALNLTSSLALAGRYGRLAEVFEVWKEGMRMGGYNMVAATYQDLGPAFDIMQKVRKRKIPYLTPYANAEKLVSPFKDRPHGFSGNFLGSFENYAVHLWYQGQWQESLEWLVWSRTWASDPVTGDPKSPDKGGIWHLNGTEIANIFSNLGFWEQALALHEHALQQKITGGYEGKCTTRHKMNILKLKRLIGKDLPADAIEQARASIVQAAGNIYEKQEYVRLYEAELGELLIHMGRVSEGEALLNQLAAAGSREARIARLIHWIKSGRTRGVEAELQKLLKESRTTGRKMDEIVFYRLYADFLEQQGRLNEALRVRRELVQLCKSFDIFTHLPVEMAKLAALLNQLGIWDESLLIANQARELLGKGQIPEHLVRKAQDILDKITRGKPITAEKDPANRVDFQPLQSVVIPLKGASWVSHLTLANPSGTDQSGMLRSTGLPVRFHEMDTEVDILATVGGKEGDQEVKVKIEPASYKIIALTAAKDFNSHGQFTLSWTADRGEGRTESHIQLEEAIGGATKAIIQAGAYKLNPFYGIPVYHHYIDTEIGEHSQPMRFVCSESARIEIYGMDGSPIAIDGQGNGSLRDAGDELFGGGDGHGSLHLPLTNGSTSFMIMIYPQQEPKDAGLSLRIECLEDGQWQLYAEDRLMPASAKD